ncbi:MarR family winged helix-turn-helix transcriptional regulator [Kineococcus rhizosphaerae]|uniref:MarR family transcriptional regulator n=1 Tax=Kineococcus rhizosphaerae TaxID=559628 RepID=A0A2T0R6H2_9ACTN|nr:MarR family transcriptional regulator [Kineococcus rhizosphaerae]PRY16775.1 MarR family transcriptional regulator [Kineococcus rhizosphaerae]
MNKAAIFDALSEPVSRRITSGLTRIALVLRTQAWRGAEPEGVTPTQAQALATLRENPEGMRLAELAAQLGVSAPTTSVRVNALIAKGLLVREAGADKRSIRLRLSPAGAALLERSARWPDFLARAVDVLDDREQEDLLRSLVKIVRTLQVEGNVAPQRTCVTCSHFRPYAHPDGPLPHHCAYVDAPFGDRHLRLACPEHEDAPAQEQELSWQRFTEGPR